MDKQRTVLIVDGHAGVREALSQRLTRLSGVRAIAVADLDGAQQELSRSALEAILYDPRTVQGEAQANLELLAASGVPIVVLTSSLRNGEAEAFLRAGAAAMMLKGEDIFTLLSTLSATIVAHAAATTRIPR